MDEKRIENLISETIALWKKGVPETEILDKMPAESREELRGVLNIAKNIRSSGANIQVPRGLTKRIIDNLPDAQRQKTQTTSSFLAFLTNWKIMVPVGALTAVVIVLATVKSRTNPPQYAQAPEGSSPTQEYAAAPTPSSQTETQSAIKSQTPGENLAAKPVSEPESNATQPAPEPADADSIVADFLAASFAEEALAADEEAVAGEAGDPDGDTDSFIDANEI